MVIVGKCLITELIVFLSCVFFYSCLEKEHEAGKTVFACVGTLSLFAMVVTFIFGAWLF